MFAAAFCLLFLKEIATSNVTTVATTTKNTKLSSIIAASKAVTANLHYIIESKYFADTLQFMTTSSIRRLMQTAVSRTADSLSGKHFCVLGGGYFLIFNFFSLQKLFIFWCPGQIRPTFEEKDMYAV